MHPNITLPPPSIPRLSNLLRGPLFHRTLEASLTVPVSCNSTIRIAFHNEELKHRWSHPSLLLLELSLQAFNTATYASSCSAQTHGRKRPQLFMQRWVWPVPGDTQFLATSMQMSSLLTNIQHTVRRCVHR